MPKQLLGIDIGGTKTAFVIGASTGEVLARHEIPSDAGRRYAPMLANILNEARALLDSHPGVAAVGVSCGGPLDAENGLVLSPPHLPGWDNVALRDDLKVLGLPVAIEHDAKACALAEWRFGAGRGCTDMVFLTLGTGIGAGIICNGQLLRGAGNGAGEIGHWRVAPDGPDFYGKPGALEGIASGAGIAAFARYRSPGTLGDTRDARDLAERAAAGNADAQSAISAAGDVLGGVIAQLIDLLAPQRIVLGSLAQRIGEPLKSPMHRAIVRESLGQNFTNCQIVDGELNDRIGDVAALSVALVASEQ